MEHLEKVLLESYYVYYNNFIFIVFNHDFFKEKKEQN